MQHSCSHSNAICKHKLKKRIELRTQEHPVLQNTLKERNDPSRTRRTDEVPFIVACSHFTRKNTRFRAPASSPQQSPCNIHAAIPMRSAIPHHFPSSPLPFLTTSHRHHFPSSPLPIVTTSLPHHFPWLPIVSNSIASHFPSSSLPIATTSLPHHFPSSPLPFLTTPLHHHFPSSPLPFLTTSLPHHFPSSPLPAITTSLPHHSPSSPLPFVATSVTRKYCFPTSFDKSSISGPWWPCLCCVCFKQNGPGWWALLHDCLSSFSADYVFLIMLLMDSNDNRNTIIVILHGIW